MKFFSKKGDIEIDVLMWWIIGAVVLVLVVIAIFLLSEKGAGALEFLKNLFRFRR